VDTSISNAFLVYGPLGLIALVALLAAIRFYRDKEKAAETHAEILAAERDRHAKEMRALEDRYITKAETWMEKNHELAASINQVLESISKRYDRR
jgi:hypothetical protein